MSVWTRIGEALAALGRGEPLARALERLSKPPEHTVAFTIAVIALGAKMAKADGRVTTDEVAAFRRLFLIPQGEEGNVARVYNLARGETAGFQAYARQIARMFRDRPNVLKDLLEGLVVIAAADGSYHPGEADYLDEVARIFGVGEAEFRAIRARYLPGEHDPWAALGLTPGAPPEEVKRRYRALVRALHPDRMIARGVPEEARKLAEERLAAVTAAYGEIRGEQWA
jgi:DnaJ like chaperone protein